MKQLFTLTVIILLMASCSSESGHITPKATKQFRVKKMYQSPTTLEYHDLLPVIVKDLNAGFRPGDTIQLGSDMYHIIDYAGLGHQCRWSKCPYMGSTEQPDSAVIKLMGEELIGTDAYYLDKLHLEHPQLTYDDLEDMLFAPKGQ